MKHIVYYILGAVIVISIVCWLNYTRNVVRYPPHWPYSFLTAPPNSKPYYHEYRGRKSPYVDKMVTAFDRFDHTVYEVFFTCPYDPPSVKNHIDRCCEGTEFKYRCKNSSNQYVWKDGSGCKLITLSKHDVKGYYELGVHEYEFKDEFDSRMHSDDWDTGDL